VPAGTFKAFRIFYEIAPRREPTYQLEPRAETAPSAWLRTWYAPEVRQLVKAEGRGVRPPDFQIVAVDQPSAAPLRLTLATPQDQARLASEEAALTGRVTSSKGVVRITVTLNGEEVARQEHASRTEVPLDVPIRVRDGRNLLLVTATDAAGETRQEARTLFYDAALPRRLAEEQRELMTEARQKAGDADAERLAAGLWAAAREKERDAEAALGKRDFTRARDAYREAQEAYVLAYGEAREGAAAAQKATEIRRVQEQTAEARRAADVAEAPRLAPSSWGRGARAQQEAEAALARRDLEQARGRFQDAAQAYREAEREAAEKTAAAAARERERLAVLRRQLEAAQQVASAAAAARRDAEQAGAPRYAPGLFGPAQAKEQEGQAALDRQDFPTAQQRFREAQEAYRRATQEAQRAAEVERREAGLLAERQREAEALRARMAEARGQAEQAEARRWAAERWAAAASQEAEGQAALGRREYPQARERFREARQAYEQAALAARRAAEAALPPLQIALAAPGDQLRVVQDTVGLAGVVRSGRGVRRVVVTLDGLEVDRVEEPTPPRSVALNLPVRLREGQNTLVVTATDVDGTIHQEVRAVQYERLVPLTVAFRYPDERARLGDATTVVAAVVESSRGVAKVTVTLNGGEVHRQAERTPQRSVALAVPLTLRKGTNAIVISAAEPDGTTRQEVRTVVYDRPKAAAAEAPLPPPPAPERWAVIIGVGRYEHRDIPQLRYAVPDALAIHDTLVGPGGFKKDNVLLLTDDAERKPTLKNVKWALGTFLSRLPKKSDTVLIFFAGHGTAEPDPSGVEKDGLAKYLVPLDADPEDLYATALPMDELHTVFNRIEAERVVAFLDTCYSGAAGGRTFASKRTRAGQVDDAFLERLTRAKGRAIITAARPTEVSVELPDLGHGLFTYYLVQGLRGAADLNRDGIVGLQELYEYLEREVTRHSRAVGANQHPVIKSELEGVLPLLKVIGR